MKIKRNKTNCNRNVICVPLQDILRQRQKQVSHYGNVRFVYRPFGYPVFKFYYDLQEQKKLADKHVETLPKGNEIKFQTNCD